MKTLDEIVRDEDSTKWEKQNDTHCIYCEEMIPWEDENKAVHTRDGMLCGECKDIAFLMKKYHL